MAGYERRYTFITAPQDRRCRTVKVEGLTLYEACKLLGQAAAAGALHDITHVRRGERAVAFFCAWRKSVRPMFGALPYERGQI